MGSGGRTHSHRQTRSGMCNSCNRLAFRNTLRGHLRIPEVVAARTLTVKYVDDKVRFGTSDPGVPKFCWEGIMLSERAATVLRIIVSEYIASANPVPSESIARRYPLGVSPATIRAEMARLEEEGYITRPHISAGGVPSDKGYRHYVESLVDEGWLPAEEQEAIRRLFHEVKQDVEDWVHLTTELLSQRLKGIGLASVPQAKECHLKHLELVAIQELLVLLVVVLREAKLIEELLTVESAVTQGELTMIASKANEAYRGLTCSQISAKPASSSSLEQHVKAKLEKMMGVEDEHECGELYFDGLRHLLSQPEFTSPGKASDIVELLENRTMLRNLVTALSDEPRVEVTIGSENREKSLQGCTIILRSYGVPGKMKGAVGVIGPTRMRYTQVIPTVKYLSSLMSELTGKLSD